MKSIQFIAVGLLSMALVTSPMPVSAQAQWSCLEPALAVELEVHFSLQDQIAGMVVSGRPDLAEISELSAQVAKLNLELTWMLREWIWVEDPARLGTFDAFTQFSWTDDDRAALVSADTDAQTLQSRLDDLNGQVADHKNLTTYYGFFGEEQTQATLGEITINFAQRIAGTNSDVEACF